TIAGTVKAGDPNILTSPQPPAPVPTGATITPPPTIQQDSNIPCCVDCPVTTTTSTTTTLPTTTTTSSTTTTTTGPPTTTTTSSTSTTTTSSTSTTTTSSTSTTTTSSTSTSTTTSTVQTTTTSSTTTTSASTTSTTEVTTSTTASTTSTTTTPASTSTTTTAPVLAGLIPGSGTDLARSDCLVELNVQGVDSHGSNVSGGRVVSCVDGDPCDTDGVCGDNACTFRVAVCIDQQDPNLPTCHPPTHLEKLHVNSKLPVPSTLQGSACGA